MRILDQKEYVHLGALYDEKIEFFPIITAVVEQAQEGYVFEDKETYLILHKFGFGYFLGSQCDYKRFLTEAYTQMLKQLPIFRIYDPNDILHTYFPKSSKRLKFERTHKRFDNLKLLDSWNREYTDYASLQFYELDLFNRFWRDEDEFREHSMAVLDNNLSGICYAAAIGANRAEIDVFVRASRRKSGVASQLVLQFINKCSSRNILPVWDCYANNAASVKLARKAGFTQIFEYNFYNIPPGDKY